MDSASESFSESESSLGLLLLSRDRAPGPVVVAEFVNPVEEAPFWEFGDPGRRSAPIVTPVVEELGNLRFGTSTESLLLNSLRFVRAVWASSERALVSESNIGWKRNYTKHQSEINYTGTKSQFQEGWITFDAP